MPIEDIVGDAEDDYEEEKTEGLMEKLGVESKEELEQLDDRLSTMATSQVQYDGELERIRDEIKSLRLTINAMLTILDHNGLLNEPDHEKIEEKKQKESSGSDNRWITGDEK